MQSEATERWMVLAEQASKEQDPQKLAELVKEINRLRLAFRPRGETPPDTVLRRARRGRAPHLGQDLAQPGAVRQADFNDLEVHGAGRTLPDKGLGSHRAQPECEF